MASSEALAALSQIVADLSRDLPPKARYQRLLEALMSSFACDASAILQLEGDTLVPRAVKGLNPDTLGRRFQIKEQPRLEEIVQSRGIVRFAADSPLPDPYDGHIDTHDHHLLIHDCMGAPLHVDGRTWGVITMDALAAKSFDDVDMKLLETFVAVAAASIRAAELIVALESDLERHQLMQQSWLADPRESELIGESDVMQRLSREAEVVGQSGLPVLIQGETGVGKELVARFIHFHSSRSEKPMVQINCAALPDAIAESELFGHISGAFSGATRDRVGKFELAHEGTLLLDEVGELSLTMQAKLLRVLQNGELQRVGSDKPHRVDVRVIAVTNRNLEEEVNNQRFRADLYHRLSVYPITVPPLRDRDSDISLLAGHFLQKCERKFALRGLRLSKDAVKWLMQHNWPGNVRELEHCISRAVVRVMGEGASRTNIHEITLLHLGGDTYMGGDTYSHRVEQAENTVLDKGAEISLAEAVDQFKRTLVLSRLRRYHHNQSSAASSLGLDKGNFHRLAKRLGIR